MQLEHARSIANRQPPKPSKTNAQDSEQRSILLTTAADEADLRYIIRNHLGPETRTGLHTFPRRVAGRPSQVQLSSLWNPINSSAITGAPATDAPKDSNNLLSLPDQVFRLYEIVPSNRADLQRSRLQSHSSLQVRVSQPSTLPSTSQHSITSPPLYTLQNSNKAALTRVPAQHTMSPRPSLHSDTPSKRPPTPAKDLEYGLPNPPPPQSRSRTPSRRSQRASSAKSDIPWNPTHPCYPHPNPHIPLASPLYNTTRIIRIPRDWMIVGDLAPTFSNTYPEILEPWVSEDDFRMLIKNINDGLIAAFSPFGWRAWIDAVLGVVTGWIWEDLGFATVKSQVKGVEQLIEEWNGQRRHTLEKEEDGELVRAIPLRRTGHLCLDIQIPDPQVGIVEEEAGNRDADGGAVRVGE